MARIRTIKPSFWEDEKMAKLPFPCRLFYIGMWNFADDLGVVRANAALLKSYIFPYDDNLRVSEVQKWIDALVKARMLIPVSHKDESYYIIRTFRSHQKFDARYPNYIIPEDVTKRFLDDSCNPTGPQRVPDEYTPREGEGEREEGNNIIPPISPEGEIEIPFDENFETSCKPQGEKEKSSAKKEKEPNHSFEEFWNLYDKKTGEKKKLAKKWLALTDEEREAIMNYIPKYIACQPDKQFRKNPETFLNNKSWNDELIPRNNGNRQLPASDKGYAGRNTGPSGRNDADNKRAERDRLNEMARAILRGSPPKNT